MFFTVTIDGREVHNVENTNPKTFTDVRVFAGDNFKPAADASYRNFDAGPNFHIGSNVRMNNEIGTIDSWGPLFRVSLDLIIHSINPGEEMFSVLTFQQIETLRYTERILAIDIKCAPNCEFHFFNKFSVFGSYDRINLDTWYNIVIERKNREVRSKE